MHNKEQWVIHKEPDSAECAISESGWFIAICCDAANHGESNADDNARRIVACVNACAGFTTDGLEQCTAESDTILNRLEGWQRDCMEAERSRDELLAALEKITRIKDNMFGGDWDEIHEARNIAKLAIQNASK